MIRATSIIHSANSAADTVTLAYDDRYRRRMVMVCDNGLEFLLELSQATQLRDGDNLLLEDGRHITVKAAPEDLMRATCRDRRHLVRTAWHMGNRHLACEIHADNLILRWDHVIADLLEKLDCEVERITAPFNPEGGAYEFGNTHGHSHGHGHSHSHTHDDDQSHDH